MNQQGEVFIVGGELFQGLEGGRQGWEGRRCGEAQGVDCGGRGGVEVGVDADGVGERERREGREVGEDDGGDVGEVDGVVVEDLIRQSVSG